MKKEEFEKRAETAVSDVMFTFIKVLMETVGVGEDEMCDCWRSGNQMRLINKLSSVKKAKALQGLAFKLENLVVEKDRVINNLKDDYQKIKNELNSTVGYTTRLEKTISGINCKHRLTMNKLFEEIYYSKKQYCAPECQQKGEDTEDFIDFQLAVSDLFDRNKIIMWKLEKNVVLTDEEREYIQAKLNQQ